MMAESPAARCTALALFALDRPPEPSRRSRRRAQPSLGGCRHLQVRLLLAQPALVVAQRRRHGSRVEAEGSAPPPRQAAPRRRTAAAGRAADSRLPRERPARTRAPPFFSSFSCVRAATRGAWPLSQRGCICDGPPRPGWSWAAARAETSIFAYDFRSGRPCRSAGGLRRRAAAARVLRRSLAPPPGGQRVDLPGKCEGTGASAGIRGREARRTRLFGGGA